LKYPKIAAHPKQSHKYALIPSDRRLSEIRNIEDLSAQRQSSSHGGHLLIKQFNSLMTDTR